MKRITLIGSVAVLALLSACSAKAPADIDQQSNTQTQESQNTTKTVPQDAKTITYSESGFSPASLEVTAGQTVVFVNNSTKPFWPASAPHPTHTDYPEFDAKSPVAPGSSFTFVFQKIGNWGYHNHLDSSKFGKIIVK